MSADGHTACPSCHPDLVGMEGITANIGDDLGYDSPVRENYEYYMINGTHIVASYSADCWDCGWHFDFEHKEPLTGLQGVS